MTRSLAVLKIGSRTPESFRASVLVAVPPNSDERKAHRRHTSQLNPNYVTCDVSAFPESSYRFRDPCGLYGPRGFRDLRGRNTGPFRLCRLRIFFIGRWRKFLAVCSLSRPVFPSDGGFVSRVPHRLYTPSESESQICAFGRSAAAPRWSSHAPCVRSAIPLCLRRTCKNQLLSKIRQLLFSTLTRFCREIICRDLVT